ncbi:hypothetical protein PI124_g10023 [Phytophthora idaei]|nr:hypothetical protein PI124_g10023 [Phytophthora idaei]
MSDAEVPTESATAAAQIDEAETFDYRTESTTFFHGINLRTQPVLTKRGRKTGKIVSRVFVILEGYLFYFQYPAATAPCGVLALQNAEYFVHSYASSALLGNFCIELRSPLRAWGTLILHFHGYTPMAVHEIKQMMNAAGAHPRRNQFDKNGIEIENSRRSTKQRRPSRLITLSGIANLIPQWARRNGGRRSSIHDRGDEDSVLVVENETEFDADADANITTSADDNTVVCRVIKGSRTSLLKVNLRSTSTANEPTDSSRAVENPTSPQVLQLYQNTRLSFTPRGQPRRHFSLDEQEELVAEQDISPEHCHELCVNGFVENAGRSLFHFIWPWEGLQHLRPTHKQNDAALRFSVVAQSTNQITQGPRIRFVSAFEPSRQFDPATMAMMRQWASPQHHQHQRLAICAADVQPVGVMSTAVLADRSVSTISTSDNTIRRNSINVASLQLALVRLQQSDTQTPAAVVPLMSADDSKTASLSLKIIPPSTTSASAKSVSPQKVASSPPKAGSRLPSPTSLMSKAKAIAHRGASPVTPPAPTAVKVVNPTSPVKKGPAPAASVPVITDIRVVQAVSIAESYSGGYMLRQYEPLKVIGRGGFGHVMVARHLPSGSLVAIKTLSKRSIATQNQIQHSRAEKTPPFYNATSRTQLYSMIMDGAVFFPPTISDEARDLMQSLLRTDPRERLGVRRASGGGASAVKQHPFFAKHHIDWTKLLNRALRTPPLRPRSGQFANFDSEFTSMALRGIDSMVKFPEKIPMDYQLFDNYNWEPPKSTK